MKLQFIQLAFDWHDSLSVLGLRPWLISELRKYGEPLRWSITNISASSKEDCLREVKVEAVVIISEFSEVED